VARTGEVIGDGVIVEAMRVPVFQKLTPSPGPPRLMTMPNAVHPLPQVGEGSKITISSRFNMGERASNPTAHAMSYSIPPLTGLRFLKACLERCRT